MSHSAPRRILVYRIGQIGDTIIALPSLWALRHAFPAAHLCLLTNQTPNQQFVPATSVLPQEGLVDEVLEYPTNGRGPWRSRLRLARLIRSHRFDVLVYLVPRVRTRAQIWRDLVFFRVAGIRRFLAHRGFDPLPKAGKGNPLPGAIHEADHLLTRLSLSGIPTPPPGQGSVELQLTQDERDRAHQWLDRQPEARAHLGPLIALGPGSKWPSKIWPEDRYAELGKRLIQECQAFPIVVGGPEDRGLGNRLLAAWGTGANAAGSLTVRETAAMLTACRLYIGNDTGAMHLAAAVKTTCVAIVSAQDWPGRWAPYGEGHLVLRTHVPCEGCMLEVCEKEQLRCLKAIEVESVRAAARSIIEAPREAFGLSRQGT